MLDNNIITSLWQVVSIIFALTLIVFFITLILNMITGYFDNRKKKKATNDALNQLQSNFDCLMDALRQEEKEKKSTKKLDKEKK